MIVVDTNLIAYLLIPGERTAEAQAVMKKDSDWIAPRLWQSELRNVLVQYLRHNRLTLSEAMENMRQAEELMGDNEYGVRSDDVLRLVAGSSCSAYDCEFVALAQEFGAPLVTVDKRILREFAGTAVSPTIFLTR